MDDQITLIMCRNKLYDHSKDGPILIDNFNTEWNSFDFDTKITFTSKWHNRVKEEDKTDIAALGLGLCREYIEEINFDNKNDKSDIIGKLSIEECHIEFTFYTKRDNIVEKKDVIDGEEVISITLNDVHHCSINIKYKHISSGFTTLSEFDSTQIIPVSIAEKILHTKSIDEVLKIIKENKKDA